MWNCLPLQCPAHDVCEYPPESRETDWTEFTSLLTSAANLLTSDHSIWTEGEVLNNIQQKLKRLLHCDKFLQLLQRVGQCLRNKVLLTLSQSYLDLAERFIVALQNQSTIFMPSRQQLEYVLIRTQSAAMLLCEAIKYSKETFCKLLQRLQIGHIVHDLVMALSVTSRLNVIFRGLLVQLWDLYKKVYPWRQKLVEGQWKWPTVLNLPEDLEKWINMEGSEKLNLSKEQMDFLTTMFKSNRESETASESVEVVSKDEDLDCIIMDEVQVESTNMEDYGEIISREEVKEIQTEPNEVEVSKSQKLLLRKVLNARSWKTLRSVWNNIDTVSQNILPRKLTVKKMRIIDNLFCKLKENLKQKRQLSASPLERKKYTAVEVQKTALKFSKHLGYTKEEVARYRKTSKQLTFNINPAKLEPVKDWSSLKELYSTLQHILKASKQNNKCKKLEKVFKRRHADIKLMKQDKDQTTAQKLIFCTSKVLLTMCHKQITGDKKYKKKTI